MIPICVVDAFTDPGPSPATPPPCACCRSRAADGWMQDVAREMNLSETAFLLAGRRLSRCAGSHPRPTWTCAATPPSPAPRTVGGRPPRGRRAGALPHPQRAAHLRARPPAAGSRWTSPRPPRRACRASPGPLTRALGVTPRPHVGKAALRLPPRTGCSEGHRFPPGLVPDFTLLARLAHGRPHRHCRRRRAALRLRPLAFLRASRRSPWKTPS